MSQEFHTDNNLRFNIEDHIADGGFSKVFRVSFESGLGQNFSEPLALKIFNRNGPDQYGVDMFDREIKAFEQIQGHPNIIQRIEHSVGRLVMQNVASGGAKGFMAEVMNRNIRPYLLMEYANGGSVARQGILPPHLTVTMANHIADALDFIHKRGLVYRDLKPENILVTGNPDQLRNPIFKIGDLGAVEGAFDPRNPRNTRQSIGIGTLVNTHKGEIARREATAQTDVYALGLLVARVMTGRSPKVNEDSAPMSLEQLVRFSNVKMTDSIDILQGVYEKATADDPRSRYSSAEEFKHEINEAFNSARSKNPATFDMTKFWQYKLLQPSNVTNKAIIKVEDRDVRHTELRPAVGGSGTRVMSGTAIADLIASSGELESAQQRARDLERERNNLKTKTEQQQRSLDAANKKVERQQETINDLRSERPKTTRRGFGAWLLGLGMGVAAAGYGWEWYKEKFKFNADIENVGYVVTEELENLISADNGSLYRSNIARSLIESGNAEAGLSLVNALEESGAHYLVAEIAGDLAEHDSEAAKVILNRIYTKELEKDESNLIDELQGFYLRLAPYDSDAAREIHSYLDDVLIGDAFNSAYDYQNATLGKRTLRNLLDAEYYWHAGRLAETLVPFQKEAIVTFANELADNPDIFTNHLAVLAEHGDSSRPQTAFDALLSFSHSLVRHDSKEAAKLLEKIEELTRVDNSRMFYTSDLAVRLAAFEPKAAESLIDKYYNKPEYADSGVFWDALGVVQLALFPDSELDTEPFKSWRKVALEPSNLQNIKLAVDSLKTIYAEDENALSKYAYLISRGLIYAHADISIIKDAIQFFQGRNGFYLDSKLLQK